MIAVEHFFSCPYCGETISMILDLSVPAQTYVEDCEVCCNPIRIHYSADSNAADGEAVTAFGAHSIEQ